MYIDQRTLPGDAGAIAALQRDLLNPLPISDWARQVTNTRIVMLDRIRPFVTRGVLLFAAAGQLAAVPRVTSVAWLLLLPAFAQVTLETVLEDRMRSQRLSDVETGPALRPVIQFWFRQHERRPFNVTGLLGTSAVLLNVFVALFLVGPDAGPLKFTLFVTTLLYANSAILGTLMHTEWFSPINQIPRPVGRMQAFFWLAVILAAVALVMVSDRLGYWPAGSLPYALAACALPYHIGLRLRDYGRDLLASAMTTVASDEKDRKHLAQELHDLFNAVDDSFLPLIERTPDLDPHERNSLRNFYYYSKDILRQARKGTWGLQAKLHPSFEEHVHYLFDGSGIDLAGSRFDLDGLDEENERLARNIVTTLTHNARQAYTLRDDLDQRSVVVTMTLEGGTMARVAVADTLDPIPEAMFSRDRTLGYLRRLLADHGGDLVQESAPGSAGKAVVATWDIRLRPLRDDRDEEDGNGS